MKRVAIVLALLCAGCTRSKIDEPAPAAPAASPSSPSSPSSSSAPSTPAPLSAKISRPAAEHIVAIGDLHGDLAAARAALRLAGAIDDHDAWIGGKLVVIQTGDAIDRGDDERSILDLLE